MSEIPPQYRSFLQVNLGHVLNFLTLVGGLAFMYGQVATKLENLQAAVVTLEAKDVRYEADQSTIQISQATQARDLADLHKAMEDDFSRRLGKLEDEMDSERKDVR